jgi:hypothetical protein
MIDSESRQVFQLNDRKRFYMLHSATVDACRLSRQQEVFETLKKPSSVRLGSLDKNPSLC